MSAHVRPGFVPSVLTTRIATFAAVALAALSALGIASQLGREGLGPLLLAMAAGGLVAAFIARWSGRRQEEPFDGRLSLLAAISCGIMTAMLLQALLVGVLHQFAV